MIICKNCSYWIESKIEKKGSATNKMKSLRVCPASKREIESDTEACEYFNPNLFYCDKSAARQSFLGCLNRRRNQKGFEYWIQCKKCRQFSKEIKEIIEKYFIKAEDPKIPEHLIDKKERRKKEKAKAPESKTKSLGALEMQRGEKILKRFDEEKADKQKEILKRHKKKRVLKRRTISQAKWIEMEKERIALEKESPSKRVLKRREKRPKRILKRRKNVKEKNERG